MDHPRATWPLTLVVHGVLLAGAAGAVFLAGGPAQGSLGIFLVCAGLALTFCPPRLRVDWRLWLAAGGVVAGAALAFLPMQWFPAPGWRSALGDIPIVPLPPSVSPVPRETAFWLAVLAVSILTGLLALSHPLRSASLLGFGLLAVIVCGTYAALAIYVRQSGWHYPFDGSVGAATFGFFPNRNHTATLLITGSVVAMGVLRIAWRDTRWLVGIVAAAGLTVCLVALFLFSGSRGGVVFLLAGTLFWVAGLGQDHRNTPLLVSLLALAAAGGVLFLLSGSEVSHRLLEMTGGMLPRAAAPGGGQAAAQQPATAADITSDFRVSIYRDTSDLIHDFPLTGTGLGTFAMVFPQYRQQSLNGFTVIHPESDWLMLFAEAGLPAGACAVALAWLLLRRARLWGIHPSWPLHWAYASAVAAACLHGVVDVPAHRVALGWWVLVLGGAGLHGGWSEFGGERSRVQHVLFVLGGVVALALGTQLIRAEWFGGPPLPPFAHAGTQDEIYRRAVAKDIEGAKALARECLRASPLYGPYYAQLGALLAQAPNADAVVDDAFRAQRLVDPHNPTVPFEQGIAWITNDTARTAALWREALIRRREIDFAERIDNHRELELYRHMMTLAAEFPELQEALLDVKWPEPDFVLAWLESATPDVLTPPLQRIARDDDFQRTLSEQAKTRLLQIWYARGDRSGIDALMNEEVWRAAAWPVQMRELVDQRRFEDLVRVACVHAGVTLALPDPHGPDASLPGTLLSEDGDPAIEFTAYWQAGNTVSARRVLDTATGGDAASASNPELWRLKAAVAAYDKDWPAAWHYLETYLRLTGRSG